MKAVSDSGKDVKAAAPSAGKEDSKMVVDVKKDEKGTKNVSNVVIPEKAMPSKGVDVVEKGVVKVEKKVEKADVKEKGVVVKK